MTITETPATTTGGYMGFVGVSTGSSSIMKVFPKWAQVLGLPTENLIGHDLPMDATPAQYVAMVEQIRDDGSCVRPSPVDRRSAHAGSTGDLRKCGSLHSEIEDTRPCCVENHVVDLAAGDALTICLARGK